MEQTKLLTLAETTAPHWAGEVIVPFPVDRFELARRFALRHYWINAGDINVFGVIGTRRTDYIGLTWAEFLRQGKRMPLNHRLWRDNPDYYRVDAPKLPTMSYVTLDGQDWYVDDDGNHRTCIARFMFQEESRTQLRGVWLSDWRIDDEFYRAWQDCQSLIRDRRLPWTLSHRNDLVRREDTAGWKLDHHRNTATLEGGGPASASYREPLDSEGLARLHAWASAPAWRRWFTRGGR